MSETIASSNLLANWKADLEVALCERCQWRFLVPASSSLKKCPHCHHQTMSLLADGLPEMPHPYPPELVVPFRLSQQKIDLAIQQFAGGIPYAPDDLIPQTLLSRLSSIYLPLWLVDASVHGIWQTEAGFDYQVVSHQESYNQTLSGWQTREVREGRIRWENRVGRLDRDYHNITAQAIEDAPHLQSSLGAFQQSEAQPYHPDHLDSAYVRLPDLPPDEAWKEAAAAFQKVAADECRQACAANHLRQFSWRAEFNDINWTLMLLPIYTSYYLDDAGQPQQVLIHGQTGHVTGARRSSMKRARQTSLTLLLIGIILFLVGLILDSFSGALWLGITSTLITLSGIAFAVGAIVPFATAYDFNRNQRMQEAEVNQA